MGSATVQGQLWGARAQDWAAYTEQVSLPLFGAVLDAARVTPGARLLDAGCGAGLLALLASLRGAQVSAVDASAALLDIARQRIPAADVRQGDLEALPFADSTFDAVTAVNSLFYAAHMDSAMRELVRVVRPGGRVVVTAWGPPRALPVSRRRDASSGTAHAAPAARRFPSASRSAVATRRIGSSAEAGRAARGTGGRGRLSLRLLQH